MSENKKKKSVLSDRGFYKPFDYPEFYDLYKQHFSMNWTPEETKLDDDVYDWHNKLSKSEKHFLTNIFRFFTEADVSVAGAYSEEYLPIFKLPEVRMMLLDFASREATHMRAYSYLIDTIGMPSSTYRAFYDYEVMVEKHDYFESFKDENNNIDIRQLLIQIAAFSAFTEGMQLFSSFIMLLNFSRYNKMMGMGEIVRWSIKDEDCLHSETKVLTPNGLKQITEIKSGDRIYQYNTYTRILEETSVERLVKTKKNIQYKVRDDNGNTIQILTPNHRILYEVDGEIFENTASELEGKRVKLPRVVGVPNHWTHTKFFSDEVTIIKENLYNDSDFYCVTVPSGAFAISYNGIDSITGNCHYEGMAKLFKTILKENLEYHTDELRDEIYDIARKMVELENHFIDLCFEMGGIEGLTADETKEYVKYICDRRLIGLGYKGIWKVKVNPLPWVEEMLNAVGHANFFERRSIDYARNAYSGSWGKFWKPVLKT